MTPGTVKVIALPKCHPSSEIWTRLVLQSKGFRLLSLKLSPGSFSSTYEREIQFDQQQWEDRLSNPIATTFIAIRINETPEESGKNDVDHLLSQEWLGCLVTMGPLDHQETKVLTSKGLVTVATPREDLTIVPPPLHYQLNAMYVLPSTRGQGIGAELITCAVACIRRQSEQDGHGNLRFSLVVNYENRPARKLYQKCGFDTVHRYSRMNKLAGTKVESVIMELKINSQKAGEAGK